MRRFAIVALALLVAACGSPSSEQGTPARKRVAVAADAAPGSVAEANWRRFTANVGVWAPEFSVELRHGEAAGEPMQRVAALQSGELHIAALPPAAATALVPELAVLSAPGLFDSQEQADYVLDRVALAAFRPLFTEKGLRLLDWIDDGWQDGASGRTYQAGVIVANKDWFERLTPHDRDVFVQAYGSAGQARADARAAATAIGEPAAAATGEAAATALPEQAGERARPLYELILKATQDFAAGGPRDEG